MLSEGLRQPARADSLPLTLLQCPPSRRDCATKKRRFAARFFQLDV